MWFSGIDIKTKIRPWPKLLRILKDKKNQAVDENIKGLQMRIGSLESELKNATTE